MPKSDPELPINTFVIRVWREWSTIEPIWRGSIEHLESKQQVSFNDSERMLTFLRSFGIFNEDEHQDIEEEWRVPK